MTPDQTLRDYWAAMGTNDFSKAALFLSDEIEIDWPQSGERIKGRSNFVAINEAYPAANAWRFTVLSIVAQGEKVVTVTDVTDGAMTARAVTFSDIDPGTGLIAKQVEYWPDPYDAPPWRQAWVSPIPETDPNRM
ncbi:MAG: polyketide cyclase [Rhodobacterales bacterium]|nr:MAG: polyketide cyclase [Rhodobacterales bacterium]